MGANKAEVALGTALGGGAVAFLEAFNVWLDTAIGLTALVAAVMSIWWYWLKIKQMKDK